MVRLTYVVESPAPLASEIPPVNLAFAAAAAARASWASKERNDSLWDFEMLDGGAAVGVTLGDGVLDGGTFASFIARKPDAGSIPPPQTQRASGQNLSIAMTGAATLSPDAPGIHDIPRNSVLFRTHAAQQTMNSSLPPAEPNAPNAIEVAAVMEERKSRGFLLMPDETIGPAAAPQSVPQRSASFNPGVESVAPVLQTINDNGGVGGNSNTNADAGGSRKAPNKTPYVEGAGGLGTGSAISGPLSASDGVANSNMDDLTVILDPDGGGDGERDGCLVLPVLRTLLAMQDEAPRSTSNRTGNSAVSRMQSANPMYGGHPPPYGPVYGHAGQAFGSYNGAGSTNVYRQASVHMLRASPSTNLTANGGVGGGVGGGGLARQSTMANGAPPARRRLVGGGTGPNSPVPVGGTGPNSPAPRRQATAMRTIMSYPMGRQPLTMDDDDQLGLAIFEQGTGRFLLSSSPPSPRQSLITQQPMGRITSRAPANVGTLSASGAGPAGPASVGGVGAGTGDPSQHGVANGLTSGRGASPQQTVRQNPVVTASGPASARTGQAKAPQQSMQQQVVQQPQPQPPVVQPASPVKIKSGKALFAWTNKLGKGKWSWFPSGNAKTSSASASTTAAGGTVTAAAAAAGTGASSAAAGSQDLPTSLVVHGLSGLGAEVMAVTPRSGISSNDHASMNGRISGNGRQTYTDGLGSPLPQTIATGYLVPRSSLQLPPIEYVRRKPTGFGEPLSPTGILRVGGAGTGGAGFSVTSKR